MIRIVSLLASATEIVSALGLKNQLVGRSHECDFPPEIKDLPICTEVKFLTDGTSYEIDQRVKAVVQEGLSVYRVKSKMLQRLKPDFIVTQTQCEVCAVSLKDVEVAVCEMIGSRPKIITLEPNALSDVWRDIRNVADGLGVAERGEDLVRHLQTRMNEIQKKGIVQPRKPTVACIEWIEPLMASGNWMPELVGMAGGINLFGEAGKHAPWMTWGSLVQKDPDVILVLPCGFDIEKIRCEMPVLAQKREWPSLKAVKTGQVYLLDGNQYFNRPGPRLLESLEILAEILHPSLFSFGHQGTGWLPYVSAPVP